jgi:outer membrane protein OmpA-like peptidoglycan-associated protein
MQIVDRAGKTARSYPLGASGSASVEFQGLDEKGNPLPDGPYTVKVSGRNRAGTLGLAVVQLVKDSRATTASLEQSRQVLVPNRIPQGSVRFTPVLSVVDSIADTQFTVTGSDGKVWLTKEASTIIPFWDWDGKDAQGTALPDAQYAVGIQVTYDNGAVAKASTDISVDSTALDNKAPQLDLTLSASSFSPLNIDGPQTLTIGITATPGADPLDRWKLLISDPRGKPFYTASGTGAPPTKLVWNGKSDKGAYIDSGEDYQISAMVTDAKGRATSKEATVTADILVEKLGEGRYKIVISSIQFAGYSSDIFKVQPELLPKNMAVLRKLAAVLNKFPEYKIHLEGYAVSELWNDPKSAAEEQRNQLIPLSLDRADEVKNGLVLLGVSAPRFSVKGLGSERPIVPNSDLENRWKNRRVEFYLDKN